jgi:hypothetical protein
LPQDPVSSSPESGNLSETGESFQAQPETPEVAPSPEAAPEPEPPVPEEELDETAGEPDVLEDLAAGAAEGTPLEDYIKQQKETREQRMMWFEALEALERFAKLPTPQQLFENRDDSYDHLIGAALDAADRWIVDMGERWDAAKAQ